MKAHEHGQAILPAHAADEFEHLVGGPGVQACHRLVREQDRGFLGERPRDRDTLALAT